MPTWIAKLGYLALAPTCVSALALGVGTSRWQADEASRADVSFEHRWPTLEYKAALKPPVAADAPVEPLSPAPETEPQQRSTLQVAALDPQAPSLDDSGQPASKGYILYANSPTHWTPVPLPDAISATRAPHNNNIRAEIEQAAMLFDVDVRMMKAFARIEFGLQSESHDRQIQVPVPAFRLGVCQILAGRHLRHPRLLDRGGQKVCD